MYDGLSMNRRDFETFVAVYRKGSCKAAAPLLGLTSAAVSSRLRLLEAELGGPLFVRLRYGLRPNKRGRILYPYAKRNLALFRACERAVRR